MTGSASDRLALRTSDANDHLRGLFEMLDEGVMIVEVVRDASGAARTWRFLEINDAWERISGLSSAASTGRNVDDVIPGIEQEWLDRYIAVAETGEPTAFMMPLRALGQLYDVKAFRVAPDRVGVLFKEVSRHRRDETLRAALLELSEHLRDLTDPAAMAYAAARTIGQALGAARVGYATMTAGGNELRIDRDWTAPGFRSGVGLHRTPTFGRAVADLAGGQPVVIADTTTDPRTASDGVDGFDAYAIRALINLPIVEDGRFVAFLYVNNREPRTWLPEEIAFLRSAAERTRVAVERRRAEQDLQQLASSLERQVEARTTELDQLWDTSPDLLLVIDFGGVFRRVNPAWTSLLGYTPDELVGHHVNEFVLADDHAGTVDAYNEAAEGGLPRIVNRYRHKDGSTRWISWTAAPSRGLTYATGRDITAERERQAELEQAQEALRQSQKLEAVGQLTGGVAHDFNNLLTIIRSSVDFLRRPDLPEARKDRYLNAVSDTVDRAAKLTGQLLAFARRQALKPEVFDVGLKVRGIAEMIDTVTGARVRVLTEVPHAPCFVRADLSQFETALVNMAVNARDAMDGEGTLTLRLEYRGTLPPIRGHAGSRNAFAAVSLTDTGSGIPPNQVARIFEPFFTTKEVGRGTGLGLSQVFGFAKQSGGDVDVASAVGEGTTFTLYLPEVEPEENQTRDGGREDDLAPLGTGQRILVVEDNIGVGQFATQILEDLGYRPTWAVNAEEALDQLGGDGRGFDLVFSDVVMPGMGGVELAKTLQRRLPQLPVVLASGYSHVLAQDGAHGFELLQKPYSAVQLGRILQQVLGPR